MNILKNHQETMLTMYKMFTKNPTKSSLATIINKSKETIQNAALNIKGTGFTESIAKSYSEYWLRIDDNPSLLTNRNLIDQTFREILEDVYQISIHSISNEAREIYINVIDEYSKKITRVYQL
jgi:hypothetical protein